MRLFIFEQVFLPLVIFCVINTQVTIKYVEEPKSADIYEGTNIDLNCTLSEIVPECVWFRNTNEVHIHGRYKYKSGNGQNTKDCSINIKNSNSKFDSAVWKCGTPTYLSKEVQLTVYPRVSILQEPDNVTVNVRENTKLDCVLNNSIPECHWRRNGQGVWIDKRYKFLFGNGKNTSVCSIVIINARKIDNATWQCAIHGKIEALRVLSREAKVIVKPVSFIVEPENLTIAVETTGKLDCVLNLPVSICYWKRNGTYTRIDGRYQYLIGNGLDTAICSIVINQVKLTDNGSWQCVILDNDTDSMCLSREANLHIKLDKSLELVSDGHFEIIVVLIIVACLVLLLVFGGLFYYLNRNVKKLKGSDESLSQLSLKKLLLPNISRGNSKKNAMNQFDKSTYKCVEYQSQTRFIWDIKDYNEKKKSKRKITFTSEIYSICGEGCRIKFKMDVDRVRKYLDAYIRSIWLSFMFVPDDAGFIGEHIFNHQISYFLNDLRGGNVIISQTKEPGYGKVQKQRWKSNWTSNRMFATAAAVESVGMCLEKGNLQIQICMRNLIPLMEVAASYNGVLDWKIDNFSLKSKQEEDGMFESLVSEPFYTSERGYRMRAELYLNGSLRRGTYIELRLRTLRGKYDGELPTAFGHVRKVMIMPVDPHLEPIVKIDKIDPILIGEDEAEWQMGESRTALIVPRSRVKNNGYLLDDTIHVKIEITPLKMKSLIRNISSTKLQGCQYPVF